MRRIWLYGAALALALAGGGAYFFRRPLTVQVVQPENDVALRIYGLGTVEARVLTRVGFEVGAQLVSLGVDAGDSVRMGQEIAALNPAVQNARVARARAAVQANGAAVAKAEAALMRAQSVFAQHQATNRRQKELARQNVTSTQRAEEAQRDENVARADLAVAEAEIAVIRSQGGDVTAALQQESALAQQYHLVAPYDALVITRHVEAGSVVKAGDPIFTLIDPRSLWVQAYIDEERAGQLALEQRATIRLRSLPQASFQGRIARIGLESDRVNEERRVWITCEDCPPRMYLGEQAEVRITTGHRARALMVPEIAITGFNGHRGKVWLVRDAKLEQAELSFGARDDRGRVELAGGLPEGAAIVADPAPALKAGRAARIGNATGAAP